MMTMGEAKTEKGPQEKKAEAMLIVNPVAAGGALEKTWEGICDTLRDLEFSFDNEFTESSWHAAEIARKAQEDGYRMVVAVGGDGTVHEVVNGLMSEGKAKSTLGIIPVGRGSDFCRTMGIPADHKEACRKLVEGNERVIDLGWMEYLDEKDGQRKEGYFNNIAGLGFDGEVTERANRMSPKVVRIIGGTLNYLSSLLVSFMKFREKDVELRVDDQALRAMATTVVVANCQYFGGNMRIAPDAVPDDGLFDVVIVGAGIGETILDLPKGQKPPEPTFIKRVKAKAKMMKNVPKLYKGTHINEPSVVVMRGKRVEVTSDDRMVIQADGEIPGVGPVIFEIRPAALKVIV